MNHLLVVLGVAAGWIGIRARFDPGTLLLGALFGVGVAFLLRRRVPWGPSLTRLPRFVARSARVFVWLIGEIVVSNVDQLKVVLRPRLRVRSAFVEVETRLQTPAFRAVFGVAVSMTPMTNLCDDRQTHGRVLLIHLLDSDDVDLSVRRMRRSLEEPLLALERLWLS